MIAQPQQTIGNSLLSKLNDLLQNNTQNRFLQGKVINFEVERLKQEAAKLQTIKPATSHLISAGIAAYYWDSNAVKKATENAIRRDNTAYVLANSAINFWHINDLNAATTYITQALEKAPNNFDVLKIAIPLAKFTGCITQALQLLTQSKKMGLDMAQLTDEYKQLRELVAFNQSIGVEEAQLQTEIEIALELLSERHIRFADVQFEPITFFDSGEKILSASVRFIGDFKTEIELESAFAQKLLELPNWDLNKLSTEFKHIAPDSHELQTQ